MSTSWTSLVVLFLLAQFSFAIDACLKYTSNNSPVCLTDELVGEMDFRSCLLQLETDITAYRDVTWRYPISKENYSSLDKLDVEGLDTLDRFHISLMDNLKTRLLTVKEHLNSKDKLKALVLWNNVNTALTDTDITVLGANNVSFWISMEKAVEEFNNVKTCVNHGMKPIVTYKLAQLDFRYFWQSLLFVAYFVWADFFVPLDPQHPCVNQNINQSQGWHERAFSWSIVKLLIVSGLTGLFVDMMSQYFYIVLINTLGRLVYYVLDSFPDTKLCLNVMYYKLLSIIHYEMNTFLNLSLWKVIEGLFELVWMRILIFFMICWRTAWVRDDSIKGMAKNFFRSIPNIYRLIYPPFFWSQFALMSLAPLVVPLTIRLYNANLFLRLIAIPLGAMSFLGFPIISLVKVKKFKFHELYNKAVYPHWTADKPFWGISIMICLSHVFGYLFLLLFVKPYLLLPLGLVHLESVFECSGTCLNDAKQSCKCPHKFESSTGSDNKLKCCSCDSLYRDFNADMTCGSCKINFAEVDKLCVCTKVNHEIVDGQCVCKAGFFIDAADNNCKTCNELNRKDGNATHCGDCHEGFVDAAGVCGSREDGFKRCIDLFMKANDKGECIGCLGANRIFMDNECVCIGDLVAQDENDKGSDCVAKLAVAAPVEYVPSVSVTSNEPHQMMRDGTRATSTKSENEANPLSFSILTIASSVLIFVDAIILIQ